LLFAPSAEPIPNILHSFAIQLPLAPPRQMGPSLPSFVLETLALEAAQQRTSAFLCSPQRKGKLPMLLQVALDRGANPPFFSLHFFLHCPPFLWPNKMWPKRGNSKAQCFVHGCLWPFGISISPSLLLLCPLHLCETTNYGQKPFLYGQAVDPQTLAPNSLSATSGRILLGFISLGSFPCPYFYFYSYLFSFLYFMANNLCATMQYSMVHQSRTLHGHRIFFD
jgi:hypothetical protein